MLDNIEKEIRAFITRCIEIGDLLLLLVFLSNINQMLNFAFQNMFQSSMSYKYLSTLNNTLQKWFKI